ncbi:alpha/beta hydrolase [Ferruginibacter lapsinanis]|uniref:alpha/beta fold hydrolase n=1 Tax=Ferruginibacter lapsinanis TaxID=563172 RepID=UPI001E5B6CA2|nr:alpha/beta hydrolase [Ferruginibacter lapsinanis]UEG48762.1 alpha/beta hydrolase [Ferruginibacter lapsinanis]
MNNHIYIFSGLGADERVFQKLDFAGLSVTFIKWITPQKNESIENYATRLLSQIKTTKPILIGLSFGGMMAIEVAKQIDTEKVIVIASAKTKKEIPYYYRVAGQLKIHTLLPTSILKKPNFIANWFFGAIGSFDKHLLKIILRDTDPVFLNWAIDKVVRWKNKTKLKNLIHIHGTADRLLPVRFIHCDFKINNAGHFMTLNNAEELNKLIRELL